MPSVIYHHRKIIVVMYFVPVSICMFHYVQKLITKCVPLPPGKRRYNTKLWKTFTDCFNCLPVAAIVDDKIFCCHGGLSPDLHDLEQIKEIARPTDVPDTGVCVCVLMCVCIAGECMYVVRSILRNGYTYVCKLTYVRTYVYYSHTYICTYTALFSHGRG